MGACFSSPKILAWTETVKMYFCVELSPLIVLEAFVLQSCSLLGSSWMQFPARFDGFVFVFEPLLAHVPW
jgi:hypothetical protein